MLVLRSRASRKAIIEQVIDVAPISISQALMTKAAIDLGLFSSGGGVEEPEDERLIADVTEYQELVGRWVKRVEASSASAEYLRKEPAIYAALYRLGQLGGDYGAAREIAKRLVEGGDLRRFMRSTQLSGDTTLTYGNLDIVWDGEELVQIITSDSKSEQRYQKALALLQSKEAQDYFKRRSTKPTLNWPPNE